jgi:parallel beta-helix repeat protein
MLSKAKLFLPFFILSLLLIPIAIGKDLHNPISITKDEDFVTLGFQGSGTKENPYIIENLRIEAGPGRVSCVEVETTTSYFVIKDCELFSSYLGVSVRDVAAGTATIEDNVITGTTGDGGGITINADGVAVVKNTCTNFVEGIHTNFAENCYILYNIVRENEYHGVSLRYSNGNLVAHNIVEGNGAHGIMIIRGSGGNTLFNNTFINNSELESYEWDDVYSFVVTSQAVDTAQSNNWYDEALMMGNKWSDYSGEGEYSIDGEGHAVDKYPMQLQESSSDISDEESDVSVGIPGYPLNALILGVILLGIFIRQVNR